VLFSEPKIPQFWLTRDGRLMYERFQCSSASRKFLNLCYYPYSYKQITVSVLFSEPKIPQSLSEALARCVWARFSALQRAENSSISA